MSIICFELVKLVSGDRKITDFERKMLRERKVEAE